MLSAPPLLLPRTFQHAGLRRKLCTTDELSEGRPPTRLRFYTHIVVYLGEGGECTSTFKLVLVLDGRSRIRIERVYHH